MCRYIAYLGTAVTLDSIILKPKGSLIRQSERARDTDVPLNGDGFGLAWYVPDIDPTPALFRSIQPAWNDANLLHLAPKIRSTCFFAHVRAAEVGEISIANCHPFVYRENTFMHNGTVTGFNKIKRKLRNLLSDEIYDWIKGQTDSEHIFALFLHRFIESKLTTSPENFAKIFKQIILEIQALQQAVGVDEKEPTYLNFVVTNGKNMLALRYISDPAVKPASLYYSVGSEYQCVNGVCHMVPPGDRNKAVLIVSERLTNFKSEWIEVPSNHFLLVRENYSVDLVPFSSESI